MPVLREYLLSMTAAAILCVVSQHIIDNQSAAGKIIKTISGLFLALTVISPILEINFSDLDMDIQDIQNESQAIIADEVENSQSTLESIITEQTKAYILDEAKKIDLNVEIQLVLSDTNPPVPVEISISGEASPYKKKQLNNIISENLGINGEKIIWK